MSLLRGDVKIPGAETAAGRYYLHKVAILSMQINTFLLIMYHKILFHIMFEYAYLYE